MLRRVVYIDGTRTARKQRKLLQVQRRQFAEEINAYNATTRDSITQEVVFAMLNDNVTSMEKSTYWEVLKSHEGIDWDMITHLDLHLTL